VQPLSAELVSGTPISGPASIANDVKMVIWDLDDTFWKGTIAESEIEFVQSNAAIVRALAARGIISSIASKNNYDVARSILEREDIWEYFVFPSISFDPKGPRVTEIIQNAGLRPQNVLFIDDNIFNLEEVRYFNHGIMSAHPDELMPIILNHPRLSGRSDPDLQRLKQYRLLEQKFLDQKSTRLSNEEFLRSCNISISFDFDVEANFDRIVELINRANQLNYTKRRLETPAQFTEFRSTLAGYGIRAACISCRDKYGDYGIVGFYLYKRTRKQFELFHFVFSCRIMNMGIEQFVYEYLGRPPIAIVPEIAYQLDYHNKIDWIEVAEQGSEPATLLHEDNKLLLVGGCELLQLASFCSPQRIEFVNRTEIINGDEYVVRYDDPSFFLADRERLNSSQELKDLPCWTHDDVLALDRHLQDASVIALSLREGLDHNYARTKDNIFVRIPPRNMKIYASKRSNWFNSNFTIASLNVKDRLNMIGKSFEFTRDKSRGDAAIFILGVNTRNEPAYRVLATNGLYNQFCKRFCEENAGKCYFVDMDEVVPSDCLIDNRHFTRDGYYALSRHIMKILSRRREGLLPKIVPAPSGQPLENV
jgi:FkbH-like protein